MATVRKTDSSPAIKWAGVPAPHSIEEATSEWFPQLEI